MEKNNPYLETDFNQKPKSTQKKGNKTIMIIAVVIIGLLVSFVVGIFLGISRGDRLVKEKQTEVNSLQSELEQANKQIDAFGINQSEDILSTVDSALIESLGLVLNEERYENLVELTAGKVMLKINENENTELSQDDFILQLKDELKESGFEWSQVSKQYLDILKSDAEEGYFTDSSVTFESRNDFVVTFTTQEGKITKVLIITKNNG